MKNILVILFFSCAILFSQEDKKTFYLKDGTTIVGTVVSENDSTFSVQSSFGQIVINKTDIIEKSVTEQFANKQIRDDLEFDFTIGHTMLAQFHGIAFTAITESPFTLFINGGSYFAASGIAHGLKDLSRINTENSINGHFNGIFQGFMLGGLIGNFESDSDFKLAMFGGSVGGLYHGYKSYQIINDLPNYQSAFVLSSERYAPLWLMGTLFSLPDETIKNIFEFQENNPRFFPTMLLTASLSANYWAPKLIGEKNLTYGDYLTATEFHFATLGSAGALIALIEPDNIQLISIIMLSSSGFGLYQGIKSNEGNNFTFEEGRFVGRMANAGAVLGMGLGAVLQVEEFKTVAILTSAGIWGGYFYGRNNALENKNISSNWDLKFNPENYFVASQFKNFKQPVHIPILDFNYKF